MRHLSIRTVHSQRHFSFPLLPPKPCPQQHRTTTESTHSNDPHSVHSLCSKALKLAAKLGHLPEGKKAHALSIKFGLSDVLSLQNRVLNFYVKCREFDDVHKLFDKMRVRNVVTWNTVICGLVDCNKSSHYMGFSYFRKMLMDGLEMDAITLNGSLRGCLEMNDVELGRELHCLVVKLGFLLDCFVNSAVVDLYGKFGLVKEARRVFDGVVCRDLVLWNVMVSCYALNCYAEEAFLVFDLMRKENFKGDGFTFSSLLSACGSLGSCQLGRQIHGLVVKLSFDLDVLVASGLVDMYAKGEDIDDARKAFNWMATRNLVSWNTMIVAYGRHGDKKKAMELLMEIFREEFSPDELTLASILSSCGSTSANYEIMQVHAYAVKKGFQEFLSVSNALINAYSKCGRIDSARQCFNSIPEPDLVTSTSLIGAYAFHNLPKECLEIFERMLSNAVKPDRIAFLGVLSCCSHAGLVTEGLHYFTLMIKDYQIMPDLEHYTCLVDLLGRAGLLDEAFDVLTSMPIENGSDTLGAFIGACKLHGDVKLTKWAVEKLFELEKNKPLNYTIMSNIYASEGQWSDVARVRKLMRDTCDHKLPGCSWTELAVD